MKLFSPYQNRNLVLKNHIIRSATFEGMADANGFPTIEYYNLYKKLSQQSIGAIITGFAYIHKNGKAMHPGQVGVENDDKISHFKKITTEVKKNGSPIFLQIAHSGRQTKKSVSENILGVSSKPSFYFKEKPNVLTTRQVYEIIQQFAQAALRAKKAGFSGIQLHAAHGYLIHQFILPSLNNRNDEFGIDNNYKIGIKFLDLILKEIRKTCTSDFPVLIKISASDDYLRKFSKNNFISLIQYLNNSNVSAIEISYGTMDYALNIFRGENIPINTILTHNSQFKSNSVFKKWFTKHILFKLISYKIKKFKPNYNLEYAALAKKHTKKPIISVGGFRNSEEMNNAIQKNQTDLVALCRPFICEVDFVQKIISNPKHNSLCYNCNICAIMCDTKNSTKCYSKNN